MNFPVETLTGLERKITITVPAAKIEEEVSTRLKKLAPKIKKIDGFRPGKVPMHVIAQRYSDSVREEVAHEIVHPTLTEALKEHKLRLAGSPAVEPVQFEAGKDFIFTATFEVFPDIKKINDLQKAKVEIVRAEVKDQDIDTMLQQLRKENKTWHDVTRPVVMTDKVTIDFEGFLNGEVFEGGMAKDYSLELGEGRMVADFEKGLLGAEIGKPFEMKVTFPADYAHKDLANKETVFKVTVNAIEEAELPELNDAFAEVFNIKEGGIEALKKDLRENMIRELEQRVSAMNRNATFDVWLEKNTFDLPMSLVDQEIEHLKHEFFHQMYGHEHSDHEKIPDFPRVLFEDKAKRRVHLGLLFSEYVKTHELQADEALIDAKIESFASRYDDPDEVRSWYRKNNERLAEVEGLVMEELVSAKILEDASVIEKALDYEAVMRPKNDNQLQGA